MAINIYITRRALVLLIIIVAVMISSGLAFVYLPKASIEVTPAIERKTIEREVILSGSAQDPDFVRFVLPVKTAEQLIEEREIIRREAGDEYEDFARGEVLLVNDQAVKQGLLSKTHLRHEATGVLFLTEAAVTVPPQDEIKIMVTAKEKGAAGNVGAGKFLVEKLSAGMQQVVYGKSENYFSGGVVVERPVEESELNQARNNITQKLKQRAKAELTAAAGGAAVREDLIAYIDEEVSVSVSAGSMANEYAVTGKVKVQGLIVDENDLLSLTLLSLRSAAGAEQEFVHYDPQTFVVEILRSDFERGEAVVRGRLTGVFVNKIGPTVFSGKNLAGLNASEVKENLQKYTGVGEVSVSFSPFWVRAVPSRPSATEIAIVSSE